MKKIKATDAEIAIIKCFKNSLVIKKAPKAFNFFMNLFSRNSPIGKIFDSIIINAVAKIKLSFKNC